MAKSEYRIAVIGDSMCDYRRSGYSSRQSPEDPSCRVFSEVAVEIELGGAANVAAWLAEQDNVSVTLFSHWALDETGFDLKNLCRLRNIDLSYCCLRRRGRWRTTRKERLCILSPDEQSLHQLVRCDRDTDCEMSEIEQKLICKEIISAPYDMVVVVDYDKGMFKGNEGYQLATWLGVLSHNCPVIANAKASSRWRDIPLGAFICNQNEIYPAWQVIVSEAESNMNHAHPCIIVTHGFKGVYCNLQEDKKSTLRRILYQPSPADNVIDVTGAGDAFTAGFAYSYLRRPQLAGHANLNEKEVTTWITEGQRWAAHCCAQIGCGEPFRSALVAPDSKKEVFNDALS